MKAHEIMTGDVVTVSATTSVVDIAKLMSERHISGVPVLADDGQMLGIVSQSDLLYRRELGTERKPKFWLRMFADDDGLARAYSKSHGLRAHDVMTRPVVSVTDDTDLQQVADVLDNHGIKRVPVVRNGKLVGLITRGDLVRALSRMQVTKATQKLDDGSIQKALFAALRKQSWLDTSYLNITVKDGQVETWGMVRSDSQKSALRILIEETEGVAGLEDHTTIGTPPLGGI
ncbi:MAG: CBS domain-containing protein [Hyphomicrobiaceae bacterium]